MSSISNSNMPIDPSMAVKAAQDREMVQRKMDIDALRKRLGPQEDPKGKLREACQGFETIFIQKLWEQMRNGVPKEGYLHSKQEAMYQSMYDNEFAKKMASAGGIGLADMLYEQLAQSLGESSRTTSPGVNPKLPIIASTSSPTSMKYAGGAANTDLDAVKRPNSNIKPLYEDFDESANQQTFALPGRGNNPDDYPKMDISQHRPFNVQQAMTAAESARLQTAQTGQSAQPWTAESAGQSGQTVQAMQSNAIRPDRAFATNLTVEAVNAAETVDFEALSHETLRQENLYQEISQGRPQMHSAASILSPEQTRILQEALRENAGNNARTL